MHPLHFVEGDWVEQLPRSKNVYLVRPDGADIVECERNIEQQENGRVHAYMLLRQGAVGTEAASASHVFVTMLALRATQWRS